MQNHLFDSPEAYAHLVAQSTPEQFNEALPHFSLPELADCFVLLQQNKESVQGDEKLKHLFQYLCSEKKLRPLGENLTLEKFLSILNFLTHHSSVQERLSDILVGLQPQVFSSALLFFQTEQLALFKDDRLLEPLQYHLTQFVHEGEALYRKINDQIEQFEENLRFVKPEELTEDTLHELIIPIDAYRTQLLQILEKVSTALSIAWNTDRIDLIEKLSNMNEKLQHQLTHIVGHPASENFPSSGLYLELKNSLSMIYDSSLQDDDASVEGLTRLSIWHLKDYWALGLLPEIHQLEDLEVSPNQEGMEPHHLFSDVQKRLEQLKIGTVGDLKRENIFSKPLLKNYIEASFTIDNI